MSYRHLLATVIGFAVLSSLGAGMEYVEKKGNKSQTSRSKTTAFQTREQKPLSLKIVDGTLYCDKDNVRNIPCVLQTYTITSLNLENCHLADEGLESLLPLFQSCPQLTDLDLSHNLLKYSGALVKYIQNSPALTSLNLNGNLLGLKWTMHYLGEAFQTNTTLKSLNLGKNGIFADSLMPFYAALMTNSTLEHLVIKSNHFELRFDDRCDDILALSKMLRKNKTLKSLDLDLYFLSDNQLTCLCAALKENNTLNNIILSTSESLLALQNMFKVNVGLTEVQIGTNQITEENATHLVAGLTHNKFLKILTLRFNWIDDKTVVKLLDLLTTNPIVTLGLHFKRGHELNHTTIEKLKSFGNRIQFTNLIPYEPRFIEWAL